MPLWSCGVRALHTVEAQYRLRGGGADGAEAEGTKDSNIKKKVRPTFALSNFIDHIRGLGQQIYVQQTYFHEVCAKAIECLWQTELQPVSCAGGSYACVPEQLKP
jgi:hypothetical protein